MKRIITIVAITLLSSVSLSAQSGNEISSANGGPQKDSIVIEYLQRIMEHTSPSYKLYPTENVWTFLELETFSGRIWQVQFSIKDTRNCFKTILNPNEMLLYKDPYGEYPGRFELYPTKNVYNFIMLDTATGSTWQVQWSQDNNQAIIEIL